MSRMSSVPVNSTVRCSRGVPSAFRGVGSGSTGPSSTNRSLMTQRAFEMGDGGRCAGGEMNFTGVHRPFGGVRRPTRIRFAYVAPARSASRGYCNVCFSSADAAHRAVAATDSFREGLAAIAGRGDRDAERHARRRLRGHAKTAELEQRWNLPVYVELVRADLIQAVDGALGSEEDAAPALIGAVERCWAGDRFLPAVGDAFGALALELATVPGAWGPRSLVHPEVARLLRAAAAPLGMSVCVASRRSSKETASSSLKWNMFVMDR